MMMAGTSGMSVHFPHTKKHHVPEAVTTIVMQWKFQTPQHITVQPPNILQTFHSGFGLDSDTLNLLKYKASINLKGHELWSSSTCIIQNIQGYETGHCAAGMTQVYQLSELQTNLNHVHIFTGAYLPRFNCMTKDMSPSFYAIFNKTRFSNMSSFTTNSTSLYTRRNWPLLNIHL
jgi:hypothetical protein